MVRQKLIIFCIVKGPNEICRKRVCSLSHVISWTGSKRQSERGYSRIWSTAEHLGYDPVGGGTFSKHGMKGYKFVKGEGLGYNPFT